LKDVLTSTKVQEFKQMLIENKILTTLNDSAHKMETENFGDDKDTDTVRSVEGLLEITSLALQFLLVLVEDDIMVIISVCWR
jgi:hypothetical protein